MQAAQEAAMRQIKLTGRELSIVRAIGFTDQTAGADILEHTRMEPDDVADAINGMLSAGFVEAIPYREHVPVADLAATCFEVNPAYAGGLRTAMLRR